LAAIDSLIVPGFPTISVFTIFLEEERKKNDFKYYSGLYNFIARRV